MDGFAFVVLVGGLAIFGILYALGTYYPGSGADVIDWKPTRSHETEVQLELDDVNQMIDAQNSRRRRAGRPEIDEQTVRAQVDAAEREQSVRRAAYLRRSGDLDS